MATTESSEDLKSNTTHKSEEEKAGDSSSEGEEEEDLENNGDGAKKQLTKNQKRKAKKKRRAKEKKEETKKRKVEAVEFVYDPNAVVEPPKAKATPQPTSPPASSASTSTPPVPVPVQETTPPVETTPSTEPSPSPYQRKRMQQKRVVDINYVSDDLARSPHKDLILEFRKPTTLEREQEVKKFYKTILDLMKKHGVPEPVDEEDDGNKKGPSVMHQMETSCGKLFQLLDRREFPKEILSKLIVIKRKLVMLEYNEAQAEYFALTIGNAPWPTMLGSKSVLEDEEKRKTLQAIKRLMTFFQDTMVPIRTMMYHPLP